MNKILKNDKNYNIISYNNEIKEKVKHYEKKFTAIVIRQKLNIRRCI